MTTANPIIFKWSLDFTKNKHEKTMKTVNPPGYSQLVSSNRTKLTKYGDSNKIIRKKSWDLALGPLKQVPMNMFIVYMAGTSISIFPIMMVGMLIVRPMKVLFGLNETFKNIEGTSSWGQKFIFIIGNFLNIALAIYKCQSMGLLPIHESD